MTTAAAESFAQLFEESLTKQEMRAGEVITAEVVRIDHNFVVVNAGLKSESYIDLEEFLNDRGEIDVQEGDFVSVAIDALENGYGETRLSRDRAKRLAAWINLEKALDNGDLVSGTITGKVKGGLTVMTNGIRAFLPGSLIDMRPVKDTTPFEGKTLDFKVIKLDRNLNVVTDLGGQLTAVGTELFDGDVALGLQAGIDDHEVLVDAHDFGGDDFTGAHFLAIEGLLEQRGKAILEGNRGGSGHREKEPYNRRETAPG